LYNEIQNSRLYIKLRSAGQTRRHDQLVTVNFKSSHDVFICMPGDNHNYRVGQLKWGQLTFCW